MDIVETFQNHFGSGNASTHDFTLVEYSPDFFIGIDNFDHVCVVVKSSGLHRFPIKYKTQKISIECNMKVRYELNGKPYDDTVHIIRCLSEVKQEKCIFLELSMVLIQEGDKSEEAIMETFNILRTFFNDKKELLHGNQLEKVANFVKKNKIQLVLTILKDKLSSSLVNNDNIILELSQNDKLFRIESD